MTSLSQLSAVPAQGEDCFLWLTRTRGQFLNFAADDFKSATLIRCKPDSSQLQIWRVYMPHKLILLWMRLLVGRLTGSARPGSTSSATGMVWGKPGLNFRAMRSLSHLPGPPLSQRRSLFYSGSTNWKNHYYSLRQKLTRKPPARSILVDLARCFELGVVSCRRRGSSGIAPQVGSQHSSSIGLLGRRPIQLLPH